MFNENIIIEDLLELKKTPLSTYLKEESVIDALIARIKDLSKSEEAQIKAEEERAKAVSEQAKKLMEEMYALLERENMVSNVAVDKKIPTKEVYVEKKEESKEELKDEERDEFVEKLKASITSPAPIKEEPEVIPVKATEFKEEVIELKDLESPKKIEPVEAEKIVPTEPIKVEAVPVEMVKPIPVLKAENIKPDVLPVPTPVVPVMPNTDEAEKFLASLGGAAKVETPTPASASASATATPKRNTKIYCIIGKTNSGRHSVLNKLKEMEGELNIDVLYPEMSVEDRATLNQFISNKASGRTVACVLDMNEYNYYKRAAENKLVPIVIDAEPNEIAFRYARKGGKAVDSTFIQKEAELFTPEKLKAMGAEFIVKNPDGKFDDCMKAVLEYIKNN